MIVWLMVVCILCLGCLGFQHWHFDRYTKNLKAQMTHMELWIAALSHDLRIPVQSIQGIVHLLCQTQPLNTSQQEYLKHLKIAATMLQNLLENSLLQSQLKAQKFKLNAQPTELHLLLSDVKSITELHASQRHNQLTWEIDPKLPHYIVVDAIRLKQILLNLLGNACKFTQQGTITLRVTQAESRPEESLSFLRLEVEDTGIGISQEAQSQIFEWFQQASSNDTTLHQENGIGLGLAICNTLAKAMKGTLTVKSATGQGSKFTLMLPLFVVEAPPIASLTPTDKRETLNMPLPYHILLAEDNEVNQLVAKNMLEHWGCTVDIVQNGEEAVLSTQKQTYDLILMDMQMPTMDGLTATEKIRKHSTTPIIALTGMNTPPEHTWKQAGLNDVIQKPFNPTEVRALLSHYLKPLL